MHWSDIVGIRAVIRDNEPGLLEIELNKEPNFFHENAPQPRKHTLWYPASDFTDRQALMCRRHTAIFRPGYLDKNYEKLLQCDPKLLMLSQQPFPTHNYPYFPQDNYGYLDSDGFGQHIRVPSIPMPASRGLDSNIPMSVMDRQHIAENQRMVWNQGLGNGFPWRQTGSGLSNFDLPAERFNPNTRINLPNHIENHSQVPFENTNAIVPNVGNNVRYQPIFTSFGNNSAIVSPNTTNVGNNVGYQPPTITNFGNNSCIVSPNTTNVGNNDAYQSPTIITSFGNTLPIETMTNVGNNVGYQPHTITNFGPIVSANRTNFGNNIGYQPHMITDFGFSPLPPIENNIEIEHQPHGDYEVSPQLINESPYEHQLPPLPFQDYELPYEYQLPPQPFQDYANQLLNMVTSSSSTESSIEKFAALDAIQDVENIGG